MTWQNPWALVGFATLALPALIHLLSRKRATLQKFPTLRFLDVSRLLPTRSPRITDVLLLLVRIGVITFAVLALAGPLFASANRTRSANARIARAIIVEHNDAVVGATPRSDSTNSRAQLLATQASASTLISTARVASALAGAEAWLRLQSARGEIVILSDFRISSVDSATLASVPTEFGLKLERLSNTSESGDSAVATFQSQGATVHVSTEGASTIGDWTTTPASPDSPTFSIHAAAIDKGAIEAIRNVVVQSIGALHADSAHPIALVYPDAPDYSQIVSSAKPFDKAWMAEVVARLRANEHFASALALSANATDTTVTKPFVTLGRNANRQVAVYATQATLSGRDALVVFVRSQSQSAASAEFIAAIAQSQGEQWATGALEPTRLSDATIATLQHAPSARALNSTPRSEYANATDSDARWFWLVALLLLGVETLLRNRMERLSPNVEASL